MPVYEYQCQKHGKFDVLKPMGFVGVVTCPDCGKACRKVPSVPAPAVIINHEQLPLGNKSRGKFIPPEETGGMGILVPSFGALEKEEVEYTAEGALEKEKERVRKGIRRESETRRRMDRYIKEAHKAPPGQRAKAIKAYMEQEGYGKTAAV